MKYLTLLFLLLCAGSCKPDHSFVIDGSLSDSAFEGELIYLVPFENAPLERVDSSLVVNGSFSFRGEEASPEICILRTRPQLRLHLQELLIVREPGSIHVKIGLNSSASGTPLNDSLQQWKDRISFFDMLQYDLLEQYQAADTLQKSLIKPRVDSLKTLSGNYNFQFVRNNKDNIVGKFVYKMKRGSFSEEQLELLEK
jgi:hypothetical protein